MRRFFCCCLKKKEEVVVDEQESGSLRMPFMSFSSNQPHATCYYVKVTPDDLSRPVTVKSLSGKRLCALMSEAQETGDGLLLELIIPNAFRREDNSLSISEIPEVQWEKGVGKNVLIPSQEDDGAMYVRKDLATYQKKNANDPIQTHRLGKV